MILQKEIKTIAEQQEVPASTIDKDWVLGHFVKAIYSLDGWKEKLIFKGGTCLHKCYIKDYRFSEDLDFTSVDATFELTKKSLTELCQQVLRQAEIPTHIESLRPLHFNETLTGYETKIKFWGADHPRNQEPPSADRWTSSIKLEIILFEKMMFPTENRNIFHPYSDNGIITGSQANCYSIEEVITEKLRSLIQRAYTAPRDYFDIWYLVNHHTGLNWENIKSAFIEKVKFKNLSYTNHEELLTDEAEQHLNKHWENTLKHQLKPTMYVEPKTVIDFCKKLFKEKM